MNARFLTSLVILLSATTFAATASAQGQPWLSDRRYGEGIGVRAGDLELHPGVAGEVGYDTNYFQNAGTASEPTIGAVRFRLTPSLSLATLGPQRRQGDGQAAIPPKVNFRARMSASYNELVATDSNFASEVSDQRHIAGEAGLTLDILPMRPWGADLYGDFVRIVQPSNNPDTGVAFTRDSVRLGAGVNWRPGGGLFEWRLGYELQYNFFERATLQDFNNAQHFAKTRGRWRFFPRTALIYDASLGFVRYSSGNAANDSNPVRARLGLNGLVTNSFALLVMAGWGASFYETTGGGPAQQFDSLIAQAELKWFIIPQPSLEPSAATVGLSSIALGYTRDFENSYLGDFYQRDRGYLDFSYFVGGTVLLSLEGGFSHITHPASFFPGGVARTGSFGENRLDATAFAEYRTSDTFGLNSTLRYNADISDNAIPTDPGNPASTDNLKFARYEIYVGARWFM